MSQICKGICHRHKAKSMSNGLRYREGQKRCCLCDCFFLTEDVRCVCCSTKLRSRPRSKRLWN